MLKMANFNYGYRAVCFWSYFQIVLKIVSKSISTFLLQNGLSTFYKTFLLFVGHHVAKGVVFGFSKYHYYCPTYSTKLIWCQSIDVYEDYIWSKFQIDRSKGDGVILLHLMRSCHIWWKFSKIIFHFSLTITWRHRITPPPLLRSIWNLDHM